MRNLITSCFYESSLVRGSKCSKMGVFSRGDDKG